MAIFVWITAHHAELVEVGAIVLAVLNAAIKLALNAKPLADWVAIAERHPRVAAFVRLLDAAGVSPVSVLQSIIDLIRSSASPGTIASAKALAVSASRPLISPPKEKK